MGNQKRFLKRLIVASLLVGFIAPLVLLMALYLAISNEEFLSKRLLPYIATKAGQRVSVERAKVHPFSGIAVEGLRYNCEAPAEHCPQNVPFSLKVGSLAIDYNPWALFSRAVEITKLRASDVQVGVSTLSDGAASPNAASQAGEQSPASSGAKSPGLRITLSDANLERGVFSMLGPKPSDRYKLDLIAIRIPKAHSHQDGEVSISTNASVTTDGLTLKDQPLTLRGMLHRSELFMPSTLDLEISAGSGSEKPLQLSGQLSFTRDPYSLTKLTVHNGIVRQSLLQLLGIAFEPLKEFQYKVSGSYSLGAPSNATINLTVDRNTLVHSDKHDLKGSLISSALEIKDDRIRITNGNVSLVDNGETILSSKIDADLAYAPFEKRSEVKLQAALCDFDKIRILTEAISAKPGQATQTGTPEKSVAHTTQPPPSSPPLRLPLGSLDIRIDKAVIQNLQTSAFTASVRVPSSRVIDKATLDTTFAQGGTLSASASGSLDQRLQLNARGKKVNMIPFANAARGPQGELLEGSIEALDIDISADGKDIRKTLQGHATISLSRLIVPSTLQEQVPFNLLFLPLDALITVFGGAINLMLPPSISSISDSIRQTLDDAGRLGIDNSIIDLGFEKGRIIFKNVDINTKNLPDFTFKGSITPDDRLDLTIFIALLKLNLPLPVVGTLSAPLPDVVFLGPELVRGLGLSLGSIAGSAASIFSSRDKTEPVANDSKNPEAGR
jgi:hypothetical protein